MRIKNSFPIVIFSLALHACSASVSTPIEATRYGGAYGAHHAKISGAYHYQRPNCGVSLQPCGYASQLYAVPSVHWQAQTVCCGNPPSLPPILPPVEVTPSPLPPRPEPPIVVPPTPEPPYEPPYIPPYVPPTYSTPPTPEIPPYLPPRK